MEWLHTLRKKIILWFTIRKLEFQSWKADTQMFIESRIRLVWAKLWIRKDEFHDTLSMDPAALMTMSSEQQESYQHDLIRRRNIAHRKSLESEDDRNRREELIRRLNKSESELATQITDRYAEELGIVCTRCLVPKSPMDLGEKAFIVHFGNHSFTLEYSGLFRKRWKTTW